MALAQLTGTVTGPYWANVLSQRLGFPVQSGQAQSPAVETADATGEEFDRIGIEPV